MRGDPVRFGAKVYLAGFLFVAIMLLLVALWVRPNDIPIPSGFQQLQDNRSTRFWLILR